MLATRHAISFETLSGRSIAIDAHNTIYQFLSIIRQKDGTPLMDDKGRVTSHLSGLFYRNARLIASGIKPVFVFDGPPPLLKRATLEERREAKEEAEMRFHAARERGDLAAARLHAQATSRLTEEMIDESKHLLSLMGIPVVQAPSEGEAQAAFMAKSGVVFASASQDYDALLFGSPRLVRNLTVTGRRKLPRKNIFVEVAPEMIDLQSMLTALGITQRQLIWIALLIGTDFNEGVKGIGPKKALKLVRECNSLEEVIAKSGFESEVDLHAVEEFFLNPPVSEVEIRPSEPDAEGIIRFLCDEHSFARERVEGTARLLESAAKEKGAQSKLEGWL